ncbi:MAG: acyltransferase family protein [Bdellovibrionota bacterium]
MSGYQSKNRYIEEIDGLRGIAILAVIINHFNENYLISGYLGVDLFFLISGYVVTSSVSSRKIISAGAFFGDFYSRRIKRLLPALIACVVMTFIVSSLLVKSSELTQNTGITSLFGFSNFLLFQRSSDYFGVLSRHNLFTHTWSLGVEEQFYILFPIIYYISIFNCEKRTKLKWTILFLGSISLIGYFVASAINPMAAFYLMPFRFWQLTLGCIAFLHPLRILDKAQGKSIEGVSLLLLLVILICFGINLPGDAYNRTAFSFVAFILIQLIQKSRFLSAILRAPPLVKIGIHSYSLYLWHWPILVLCLSTIGLSSFTSILIIVLIFVVTVCSYNLIEKPFREKLLNVRTIWVILGGISVITLTSLLLFKLKPGFKTLYQGKNNFDLEKSRFTIHPTFTHCANLSSFKTTDFPPPCFYKGNQKSTLWLLGDSTTWSLKSMASAVARDANMNIVMFADSDAFPSAILKKISHDQSRYNEDRDFFRKVFPYLLRYAQKGDTVLITANLGLEFSKYEIYWGVKNETPRSWAIDDQDLTKALALSIFIEEMNKIGNQLAGKNIKLVLSAPLPKWTREHLFYCEEQIFRSRLLYKNCQYPLVKSHVHYRSDIMKALMNFKYYIFDPFDAFCSTEQCYFKEPGRINRNYWIDETHLSTLGGEHLSKSFIKFLEKARRSSDEKLK